MLALKILGIIALVIIFLGSLKATITIEYNGEVALSVRVLFINIGILPSKEKKRKQSMSKKQAQKLTDKLKAKEEKKRAKKAQKKKEKEQKKADIAAGNIKKEKKTPGEILDIVSLVANLVKQVIGKFFGHLRIKIARIRLKIGTGDAATTAITYGAVTQAINVIFPLLDGIKTLSLPTAKDIDIQADFTCEETEIDIKLSFALRVWHLFHVAFAALGELIKYFFKSLSRKDEKSRH